MVCGESQKEWNQQLPFKAEAKKKKETTEKNNNNNNLITQPFNTPKPYFWLSIKHIFYS